MITVITFKAISERRVVHRNIPIEHNFEEIPAQMFHGVELSPTSVESQVINMLDETDKSQIMVDYNFDIILDYYPKKHRKKKVDELKEFMEYCQKIVDKIPSFKRPLEAIISESKDLFGKGKSNEAKLKEIIKRYELIMKGADGAFNLMNNILASSLRNKLSNC
jgi:predicted component of type VI protein secretion system